MPSIYMGVIVPAAILLPLATAVIRNKYWQNPGKMIFIYLVISGIFNVLAATLAARGINNLPLLHLYTVIEFTVVAAFFRSILQAGKARTVIGWSMLLFPLMAAVNIYLLNSIFLYNLIPRSVEAIIIVIFCIHYLMKSLSFSAGKTPFFNFAVVVSFLMYFSGSLALFALSDFIIANKKINSLIWNTHATFVLIMYLIIAVAYLKTKHEK